MKKIYIADMTLAESGRDRNRSLSFREKIEIAKHLDASGVDVIELHGIEDARTDTLFIRTVASFSKNSVLSVPVGVEDNSADAAAEALSTAAKSRLRVCVPVSTVQMEYFFRMKPAAVLDYIKKTVSKCASLSNDVEFRALDATRAEKDFLVSCVNEAISSGATVITLCDNAATMMPDTLRAFISDFTAAVPEITSVRLGILCENKYDMALSSAVMAISAGASEIKVSVGDDSLPSLETASQILRDCGDKYGISSSIKYTEILRHTKQIKWIKNAKIGGNTPFDSGTALPNGDSEVFLTSNDDLASVTAAVMKLGYDLSEEDNAKVYEAFRKVAETKDVSSRELDAIVASESLQVPPTYRLISYLINSSNVTSPMAHVKLEKNGRELQGMCVGNGPIDSAFLAIEQIVGHHYELDDFQIQAVTEGRQSLGSALIRLRSGGKIYSGNGISTDIIGASISAYISAVNKVAYEEVM